MKIYVKAELGHGRSGVEARSPDLRLTSHGLDEQEALQSLQRGILAWCQGLQSMGRLEKALRRKQLKWEPNGETLTIELKRKT
jgi:hypothetical protein